MAQRFLALDGLRGIAALAVVFYHMYSSWAGYLAVDLFFVLSGFILAHVYFFVPERVSMWTFTVQRVARLYPLHVFTLGTFICAYLIVNGAMPDYEDGNLYVLFQHLTLTNNVGLSTTNNTFNGVSWSISVEFWLNIALFALVPLILSTVRLLTIALLCFAILLFGVPHLDQTSYNIAGLFNSGLLRGAGSMALGILSYKLFCAAKPYLSGRTNLLGLAEITVVALTLLVVFSRTETRAQIDFSAPVIFAFMVPIFAMEGGTLSRLFSKCSWLGDISYSVYLNHLTLLVLAREYTAEFNPLVVIVVFIAVVLVYSRLTFIYIEGPARRAIRRLAEPSNASLTPQNIRP